MHISHRNDWAFRGLSSPHNRQQTAVCSNRSYNNMSTYRRHTMDVIFPVSSVEWWLRRNNSCWNVWHKGLAVGVAPLLISIQLKYTHTNSHANSIAKLIYNILSEICPSGPNGCFKKGLWMIQGLCLQRSTSPHISTSSLVGNISGEDVRNPFLPKALMTSRDCWRVHFDSWMWQSPLQQRLREKKESAVQLLTKSASLSLYHFWKLNTWPGELCMWFLKSLHYSIKPGPFTFQAPIGWTILSTGKIEPFTELQLHSLALGANELPCSLEKTRMTIKSHVSDRNLCHCQWWCKGECTKECFLIGFETLTPRFYHFVVGKLSSTQHDSK